MSNEKKILRNVALATLPLAAMAVDADAQAVRNADQAKLKTQKALKLSSADLKVIQTDLSRLRGASLVKAKDNKATAIEKQVRQLGGNLQIQWVKGNKIDPRKRQIIQING